MKLDLYADLAAFSTCPSTASMPAGLASGFVDRCTEFATRPSAPHKQKAKNAARSSYFLRARTADLRLPNGLDLDPPLAKPLREGWLAVEVAFTLCGPWYSKDDRSFHVLENPVRKDRVFGVPYMSAGGWKGLSRWAFRITTGVIGPVPTTDRRSTAETEAMSLHLFGNEKGAHLGFQRGALIFYPTWFSTVGFEVINPHDRRKRAGTFPIVYEVVPPHTPGTLRFLYAPAPDVAVRDGVEPVEALTRLLDAEEQLLTVYGFSAKRTAGWGAAKIGSVNALGHLKEKTGTITDVKDALGALLASPRARG